MIFSHRITIDNYWNNNKSSKYCVYREEAPYNLYKNMSLKTRAKGTNLRRSYTGTIFLAVL